MHWILTIFIYVNGYPAIDHQEFFAKHNCQEAAIALHKSIPYGSFTCSQKDDVPMP